MLNSQYSMLDNRATVQSEQGKSASELKYSAQYNGLLIQYIMNEQQRSLQQMLASFHEDEIQTTKHLLANIEQSNTNSSNSTSSNSTALLLAHLNTLLNSKALPQRQRRDVAGIARLVADSKIFPVVSAAIQAQLQSPYEQWSIYPETLRLVTEICWENPHLIEDLMANAPQTIDQLLSLLSAAKTVPEGDDSLTQAVNFLHSVSLKQSPVRSAKMPTVLTSFLEGVFTSDRFCDSLESKRLNLLYSALSKFNSNVPETDTYILRGLLKALMTISQQYSSIGAEWAQTKQGRLSFRERCRPLDRRLVALLKLEEKSRASIFEKIDPLNFIPTLKILAKIATRDPLVLVDSPYDNKMLVNTLQEVLADVKEWKNDLRGKFGEEEQQGQKDKDEGNKKDKEGQQRGKGQQQKDKEGEEKGKEQDRKGKEGDRKSKEGGQRQMLGQEEDFQTGEEELVASRIDFDSVTSDYYSSKQPQIKQFDRIHLLLTTVRSSFLSALASTLDAVQHTHDSLQGLKGAQNTQGQQQGQARTEALIQQLDFVLQLHGSRLDRLLNLAMKVVGEQDLVNSQCYDWVLPRLGRTLDIFYSRGIRTHIQTLHSLIPQLNNMTSESNSCFNRFIFERIDEDSMKTHLHLRITSIQNCKNLISDTIIKFGYYLSDYPSHLQSALQLFLKPMLEVYATRYLSEISQREILLIDDVEVMRMMVKVVVELFPNLHKCEKEQLMRTKLYYYCILLKEEKVPNIFAFLTRVAQIVGRHDLAGTEELRDTHHNRERVVTSIFVKLIMHKLRTFYATVATYHDDLRKLATPALLNTPLGKHRLPQEFMFQGHAAYLQALLDSLKGLVLSQKQNNLGAQVAGMLLHRGLDFRINGGFQNTQEEEVTLQAQQQYRDKETQKFNLVLEQECQKLFDWLVSNLHRPISKLPIIVKKCLHYSRQKQLFSLQDSSNTQNQVRYVENCLRKVSEVVDDSHFLLEGSHLNLGIRVGRKKRVIDENQEVDLKGEVNKLANSCLIVAQFMLESNANEFTKRGLCRISQNYVTSLVDFSLLFINKFAAQIHFPNEANTLVQSTLWMIECYLAYKDQLQEMKEIKKKDRKIRKKIEKKMEGKAEKRKEKKKDSIKRKKISDKGIIVEKNAKQSKDKPGAKDKQNTGGKKDIEVIDLEQRPPTRKQKRNKKHRSEQSSQQLLKQKSKVNLHQKRALKTQDPSLKPLKKEEKKAYFKQKIEEYIRLVLLASNRCEKTFLKSLTLQYILRFMSVNAKKNCLSKPPSKSFEISLIPYLSELFKLKITDSRMLGFHLILCRLGLKQLTEDNIRVNYETGIKRYMFDHSEKEVPLGDFLTFLETCFRKPPSLPHILEIVYRQEGKPDKQIPFTIDILNGIVGTSKVKSCTVRLKKGVQLNLVTSGDKKAVSPDQQKEKEKQVKMSDYVPEGDINPFIGQIITNIITRLVSQIASSQEHLQRTSSQTETQVEPVQPLEPFNLKVLISALHYLLRECPSLVPWVAKFKCKRIIINALKAETGASRETVSRYVFGLLNRYGDKSQNINQIGFLQVLIRLASPFVLNTVSCLIFQLCLDSTPLVLNNKQNKQGQTYISFGSVVRQKVASELQLIIFGGEPLQHLFRKCACLNLMTVLLNNREMSKLLIESNFIGKLYSEYSAIMTKYSEKTNRITLPGVYLTKIYIPFILEPLALLQELNIAFHHNKKLNKNQPRGLEYSLVMLSEDAINGQLIPADVLKKNKFKGDWPYGKKDIKQHQHNELEGSDDDSMLGLSHSDSSMTDEMMDEDDSIGASEIEEERRAALEMLEEEYISLESNNHSQLLNDEWDYSNSQEDLSGSEDMGMYPEEDDRIIEQQIERQLAANRARDQQNSQQAEDQDQNQDQGMFDDDDSPMYDDEGEEIDMDDLGDGSEQGGEGGSHYYEVRSSISDYFSNDSADSESFYTASEELKNRFKEEQAFYENVTDVITFEKLSVVPKISRVEILQVYNLRLFLQLYNRPQRLLQEKLYQNIKSSSELTQDKQITELMPLLQAFSDDRDMKLCHYVEWTQIYRYDHFLKVMPLGEQFLSKIFSDEQGGIPTRRRRHGLIHREHIELPGWGSNLQMIPHPSMAIRVITGEHLHAEPSEQEDQRIQIRDLAEEEEDGEEMDVQEEQDEEEEEHFGDQQEEAAQLRGIRVNNIMHTDADIDLILRQLNMNMTLQEFHAMPTELQNDIIQNYYMADPNRDVPPNSPQNPHSQQIQDLSRGRVREGDPLMSPRMGGQPIEPEAIVAEVQSEPDPAVPGNVQDEYRKMSQEHIVRVSRDLLESINKDGRNNNKFYEMKEQQLSQLLVLLFDLSSKQHRLFPYNLFETACINTANLGKVVSSLMAVLMIALEQAKGNKIGEQARLEKAIDSELILKIVHLLFHLTSNYSVAMQFLLVNQTVIPPFKEHTTSEQQKMTSLEMLIRVLKQIYNLKHPEALKFLVDLLENITMHHFYKSINTLVANTEEQTTINNAIQISQDTAFELGSLLQSEMPEASLHAVSRIIMRLSLNEKNIGNFIVFMKQLVSELTQKCLNELQVIVQTEEEPGDRDYLKIVSLMNIFFEMVVSFKTYPTNKDKHHLVLKQLRDIVAIDSLKLLCQTATKHLFSSPRPFIQTLMGEVLECFFILYEIGLATTNNPKNTTIDDTEHKHMAELGQIQQLRMLNKSSELAREEEIILGNFNLSRLWKQSISQPVFKTFINNCIRKKLQKSQASWGSMGIFDVPIFKVAISTPHMLSFDNKHLIFKAELKRLRKKAKYHMMHLHCSRDEVFEDSFTQIMQYSPQVLKGKLKIEFREEQGEDAGGITRQWFQLLSRKMFDANYALFTPGSSGNTYHPSPQSYVNRQHLEYFKFIGRITGKALYDGYLLDAYFTPAFYKHILNLPITYLDMEEEDYEYFNSLKWIMENSPIQDYLELNFTYSFDNFGQITTKELLPGGQDVLVTEQNKYQYVQLSSYAKMATSVKKQLEAFLQGFHDLIPHRLIRIFNEKELEILISGRPTIDIEDLRRNTDLVNYLKHDQIIVWFFEVLEEFDMELRTAFLQFVTGSSRVPVEGFKELRGMNGAQKFNIHREFQEERLPRAHTCFNQLDLPNYKSKQVLVEKLMLAITQGKQGFHLL